MAKPIVQSQAANAAIDEYLAEIEALGDRALNGEINKGEYEKEHKRLAIAAILLLFLLGGGDPNSRAGKAYLDEQNRIASSSSKRLSDDIFSGRYSERKEGDKILLTAVAAREMLFRRFLKWLFQLARVWNRGQILKPPPPRMITVGTWHLGATEQHCKTCLENDGVTRTQAEWERLAYLGVEPQGTGLECGGWNCDCAIEWKQVAEDEYNV